MEKDFYKLNNLNSEDIAFIKMLFDNGHPLAKRNHASLLNMLMAPFQLADQVKHLRDRTKLNQLLNDYSSNILEDYHAKIEKSFIPLFEGALNGDISFYNDERCIPFLQYLCTQYMRTKGTKDRSIELCRADKSGDLSRAWNVIIHTFATNIGASLYLQRRRRKLILVRNDTEVPFITGDQPAINLKANRPHPPENLSIYYPISPKLALILGDVDEDPLFPGEGLAIEEASTLNKKLFEASYKQVFASTAEPLTMLCNKSG